MPVPSAVPTPRLALVTLLAAALALAPAACDDGEITPPGGSARVSVSLTDAPGDVEAVWVEITEIHLQGDEGPVVLLDASTGLVEITALVGSTQELADAVEVPPGTYGQLRMVVGGAVLETVDGEVYVKDGAEHPLGLPATGELACPGCSETGLEVVLGGAGVTLEAGAQELVLDFDVARSFGHPAGDSGRWIMRPVVHSTLLGPGAGDGGEIEGEVVLAAGVTIPECPSGTPRSVEDFVPTASASELVDDEGDVVLRTGEVEADGEFEIDYLPPEIWNLGWLDRLGLGDWELAFTGSVEPLQAVIEADETVDGVVYTINSATCRAVGG